MPARKNRRGKFTSVSVNATNKGAVSAPKNEEVKKVPGPETAKALAAASAAVAARRAEARAAAEKKALAEANAFARTTLRGVGLVEAVRRLHTHAAKSRVEEVARQLGADLADPAQMAMVQELAAA